MQRMIAGAIGIAAGTDLGFLYADMDSPVLISRVEVVTEQVLAGGEMHIKLHAFRLRNDCNYSENRTFYGDDGTSRSYSIDSQRQGQPLGAVVEERHVRIPAGMSPGPAEMVLDAAFVCGANWLQQWWPTTVSVRHIYFIVAPPAVR